MAQWQASQAEFNAARQSLAAQVTKRWFNCIEAQQQVRLAEKTAHSYRTQLNSISARLQRGLSQGLDLRRMRSQSASAEAELEMRRSTLDRSTRQLEILLGRYPSASATSAADLPALPAAIPAGLPAELLTRRPDLLAAERRLAAADKTWQSSRKQRLPAIRLTAAGGTASQDFNNLLDHKFSVWSLAAQLTQPLFQGGRIRASIDRAPRDVSGVIGSPITDRL